MRLVDNIFNSMLGGKAETSSYTYYDYLESDGNGQYIDTDVVPNSQYRMVVTSVRRASNQYLSFGETRSGHSGSFGVKGLFPQGVFFLYNGQLQAGIALPGVSIESTYDINNNVLTVTRSGNVSTYTAPEVTFVGTTTIHLFNVHSANQGQQPTRGCIKSALIYNENGTLVRDLRPAVRDSDGVAGMHDVVNDVFYTNANPAGDNFLYGNLT